METWITNVGTWVLSIVLLVVGFVLIVRAVLDVRAGLGEENKDWKTVGWGIVVGLIGGLLGWAGAQWILDFFKTNGQNIPKM